jgi:hypothetical protein
MSSFSFSTNEFSFVKERITRLYGSEVFGDDFSFIGIDYDQAVNPIISNKMSTATTLSSLNVDISAILADILSKKNDFTFQAGIRISDLELEGFRQTKGLKVRVITNEEIAIVNVLSVPIDFVFEYCRKALDYIPLLKSDLGYLCNEIMQEDDENLTDDAINVKRSLLRYFVKT